jgi:hypothetical protein
MEILANIKNKRDVATEPWNAEAALEYTLAAAHLLSKEPGGASQAALLVDKIYGEYFDQEVPENKKYWNEVKKDPQLNLILQPYAAFFNAESAYWRSKSFSEQGKADFALNWSRKATQQYNNALASSKGKTLFLTHAAEQRISTLTQKTE